MRNWLKTILFCSAFSPALLSLAYVRFQISGLNIFVYLLIAIGLIGSFFPILIISKLLKSCQSFGFEAKKVESNDFMVFVFVASYFVPIIARGAELELIKTVLILVAIFILLWVINAIPAHPLLQFMKYKFYKVESSNGMVYTLISKNVILDPKNIKAVKKISNSMLIEEI